MREHKLIEVSSRFEERGEIQTGRDGIAREFNADGSMV
jgi:hypothetical protein